MDLVEIDCSGMYWIYLAQDSDQLRILVNIVLNIWSHKMLGNSSIAEKLAACQEELVSFKLAS
jgi:hypothetical protein